MAPKFNDHELEYLQSLSAAVLHKQPRRSRIILLLWIITVIFAISWAAIATVEEIVRSEGEVIPVGENQVLQNLEGGIIEEIVIKEGDIVKINDLLLKINNSKTSSTLKSNEFKTFELKSKIRRLNAEITMETLEFSKELIEKVPELLIEEQKLYDTNMEQMKVQKNILNEQLKQQKQQLNEVYQKIKHLKKSYALISEEVSMTEPMVTKGVRSKIDYLKLQREANRIEDELNAVKLSIPRLKSLVKEDKQKLKELRLTFQMKARQELTKTLAELQRATAQLEGVEDSASRTLIQSPVKGMIQKLHVHTIGGVVRPGMDLVEIVPISENLIIEVKVAPKDIAFVYPEQKAKVKFTAYDFSIYGALDASVLTISPDTQTDEKGNTFYIVRLKTDQNFLGDANDPLKIIPGMVVNADIITGKRTILDYIVKPMLKSKDYVFTDR